MKRFLIFSVLVLLLAGCSISSRMYHVSVPESTEAVDLAKYEEESGEYDMVYLEYEKTREHFGATNELAGAWNYVIGVHQKKLILNPDNEKNTTLTLFSGAGLVVENVKMLITYPEGDSKIFGLEDFRDEDNSGNRIKHKFVFPNVTKGTILDYSYEYRFKYPLGMASSFINNEEILQFNVPCEHMILRFAYPDWWEVDIKDIASDNLLDYSSDFFEEQNKKVITVEKYDIPAYKNEPYSAFFKEWGEYLEYTISKLDMGDIYYTGYDDWYDFTKMYKQYAMGKDGLFSNRVAKTTKELINDLDIGEEIIEKIIDYIHEKIELQEDNIERNYAKILKDGLGDPFRITGLTNKMLLKAGIDSKILMVHNAKDGYFDEDFISTSQFSFPAIHAKVEEKDYFIFPYLKYLDINHVPEYAGGQKAIVIPISHWSEFDYSEKIEAEFMILPYGNQNDNTITENYILDIDEDGIIHVQEEKILTGSIAYGMRIFLDKSRENEKDDLMEELLTYNDGDIDLISYEINNREDFKKPLIFVLSYEIDNLVMITPEEVIFQTGGLFSASSMRKNKIKISERKNPIKIHYDQKTVKNIKINYSEDWEINSEFENKDYENQFGTISSEYSNSENSFQAKQILFLKNSHGSADEIRELLKLIGRKSKLNINSINFNVKM